ncbi:LysR family transcriptional regulator [Salinarimonas sp. NSM]|uniref:LysR family transcriptional regulator n=1 Tax=Salinarimonas sp. NSM TaxID=3458003 RepID=UPI004035F088
MDLNLLLAFEALDKTRSVSAAARMLGLSQPATSAALGRLRRELDDELFSYVGRRMEPTPKARRLAPTVLSALADLRGAIDEERPFDPATTASVFTVAMTDYGSAVVAPALVARLGHAAPGADLRIVGYEKREVGALIDRGAVDAAIGVFGDPPERTVVTSLLTERLVGVARADHPALRGPLDTARFAALDHVLVTQGRDAIGIVDELLAAQGLSRRVALALPHLMAVPEVLRASDLVAAVPSLAAARFGEGLGVFALPLPALAPWRLQMLWSPFARSDRAQAWLRARIVEICAALPAARPAVPVSSA